MKQAGAQLQLSGRTPTIGLHHADSPDDFGASAGVFRSLATCEVRLISVTSALAAELGSPSMDPLPSLSLPGQLQLQSQAAQLAPEQVDLLPTPDANDFNNNFNNSSPGSFAYAANSSTHQHPGHPLQQLQQQQPTMQSAYQQPPHAQHQQPMQPQQMQMQQQPMQQYQQPQHQQPAQQHGQPCTQNNHSSNNNNNSFRSAATSNKFGRDFAKRKQSIIGELGEDAHGICFCMASADGNL